MSTAELLTAIAGGLVLVPFIQGFMAMLKTAVPACPNKYWPAVSMLVGVALNLVFATITAGWWVVAALVGSIAGLAAAGIYDYSVAKQAAKSPTPQSQG